MVVLAQVLLEQRDIVFAKWQDQGGGNLPLHVNGLFELGLRLLDAEIAWLAQFIPKFEGTGD